MKKTYNEIVSSVREAARDSIRLEATNKVRTKLLTLTKHSDSLKNSTISVDKTIARLNFAISEVKDNDPDKEETMKEYNEGLANCNKEKESIAKEQAEVDKIVAELTQKIQDIQDGKVLVSSEHLEELTSVYLAKAGETLMLESLTGNDVPRGIYSGISNN